MDDAPQTLTAQQIERLAALINQLDLDLRIVRGLLKKWVGRPLLVKQLLAMVRPKREYAGTPAIKKKPVKKYRRLHRRKRKAVKDLEKTFVPNPYRPT